MDIIEDIFESSLNLEETHFREGHDEGYADGLIPGQEEGRQVGLKTGFESGEAASMFGIPQFGSTRIQKTISKMDELLQGYPIWDPENESVSDLIDSLRLKFKIICASLNMKLAYNGYPKASDGENFDF